MGLGVLAAVADRPPLIGVVTTYLGGMIGGCLLGCWSALYFDDDRKRIRTALIGLGVLIMACTSAAFILGFGVS